MSDNNIMTLIIAVALLLAVGLVVFFLRGRIKNAKVQAGGISASVGTHEPDGAVAKNIEQISQQGGNRADLHGVNVTVDGLKQTARKDNTLNIGGADSPATECHIGGQTGGAGRCLGMVSACPFGYCLQP